MPGSPLHELVVLIRSIHTITVMEADDTRLWGPSMRSARALRTWTRNCHTAGGTGSASAEHLLRPLVGAMRTPCPEVDLVEQPDVATPRRGDEDRRQPG